MTTITKTAKIGAATRSTSLPEGADELTVRDKDLTGFALRIRKSTARYVMAGRISGTTVRRTVTLGDANSMTAVEARSAAMKVRNEMRAGNDPKPLPNIAKDILTFDQLADRWLELWATGKTNRGRIPRPASIADAKTSLKRAKAFFGQVHVTEIDGAALRRFRTKVLAEDVSGSAKRKALGVLSQVLDYAEEAGEIDTSPARGAALPSPSPSRDRWLTAKELSSVWLAAGQLGKAGCALRFLCAMPVRLSIVTGLDWSMVDLEARTLTIPGTQRGNKAGTVFVLPITDLAQALLERQPTRTGLVFRGRGGKPLTLGSKVKKQVETLSGVTDWRIHDLRRTVVTLLADADHEIDVDACDLWLMHKRQGIAAVYQRSSRLSAMRRVADRWDRLLSEIIGQPKEATIVRIAP